MAGFCTVTAIPQGDWSYSLAGQFTLDLPDFKKMSILGREIAYLGTYQQSYQQFNNLTNLKIPQNWDYYLNIA